MERTPVTHLCVELAMNWEVGIRAALILAVSTPVVFRMMRRAPRRVLSLREFHSDEAGAAGSLDFVLTTTFFLPIVFTIMQFLMLLNAWQFVKYASYYAARSACVVIPESYPDGARNAVSPKKLETIREAAAFAVSPVSPTVAMSPGGTAALMNARHYRGVMAIAAPLLAGGNLSAYARSDMWHAKSGNALYQTRVELLDQPPFQYAAFDPVVVRVEYDFRLAMPFAGVMLGAPRNAMGYYLPLSSTCVMMNEGTGEKPSDFGIF